MSVKAPDRNADFVAKFSRYWNPDLLNSFNSLHTRLINCSKVAIRERAEAIINLSSALKHTQPIVNQALDVQKALLKKRVEEIRSIQKELAIARALELSAYEFNTDKILGDLLVFSNRLDGFACEIQKVYKDALYPFLLTLRNAESGWDPSTIICKTWDYYNWWHVHNAELEINKTFPKPALPESDDKG